MINMILQLNKLNGNLLVINDEISGINEKIKCENINKFTAVPQSISRESVINLVGISHNIYTKHYI